jgi:hypothetical protein
MSVEYCRAPRVREVLAQFGIGLGERVAA